MLVTEFRYKLHGGPTFDPVGRCSHVTLMHEKTLLIQPNFSSKKWRRVEKTYLIRIESQSKVFSSKSQSKLFFKSESGSKTFFRRVDDGSNMFFRRVVIFSKRNWAGSKAFSHASASCDYMSLPILAGSKVGTPCISYKFLNEIHFSFNLGWFQSVAIGIRVTHSINRTFIKLITSIICCVHCISFVTVTFVTHLIK